MFAYSTHSQPINNNNNIINLLSTGKKQLTRDLVNSLIDPVGGNGAEFFFFLQENNNNMKMEIIERGCCQGDLQFIRSAGVLCEERRGRRKTSLEIKIKSTSKTFG